MKYKTIPQEIKDRLLVKTMHRCCLCPHHEDITEVHHILPIKEGGPNTEENLMVVCPTCHSKIHRIRRMYTPKQLKMYKERWVELCWNQKMPIEECLKKAPGIILPSFHNQTPPEQNFVGRKDELVKITKWYRDPNIHNWHIGWLGRVWKECLSKKMV